jgi:hypothetical protein
MIARAAYIQSPVLNNVTGGVLSWSFTPDGTYRGRFVVGLSTTRSTDITIWDYYVYNDILNNIYTKNAISDKYAVGNYDTIGIRVTSSNIIFYRSGSIMKAVPNITGALPLYACFYFQDANAVCSNISFIPEYNTNTIVNNTELILPASTTLDFNLGSTFLLIPASATFSVNFINLPSSISSVRFSVILNQSAGTPGYINSISVSSTLVASFLWQGGIPTVGSNKDIQVITLYSTNGTTWNALNKFEKYA